METKERNALIVGGSSGLGLELALILTQTQRVWVTGRSDPKNENVVFRVLNLDSQDHLAGNLDELIGELPEISLLVYAAGFYEKGRISDLDDQEIADMLSVSLLAPAMILQRLLKKQGRLQGFIAITSTSQWIPRLREPVYAAGKAGLAMLAKSVSQDDRVGKVLVAGPAGMATNFWRGAPRADVEALLNPRWVAQQIIKLYQAEFGYKSVRILRDPPRVMTVEE